LLSSVFLGGCIGALQAQPRRLLDGNMAAMG
jgi:hypothetical protein